MRLLLRYQLQFDTEVPGFRGQSARLRQIMVISVDGRPTADQPVGQFVRFDKPSQTFGCRLVEVDGVPDSMLAGAGFRLAHMLSSLQNLRVVFLNGSVIEAVSSRAKHMVTTARRFCTICTSGLRLEQVYAPSYLIFDHVRWCQMRFDLLSLVSHVPISLTGGHLLHGYLSDHETSCSVTAIRFA